MVYKCKIDDVFFMVVRATDYANSVVCFQSSRLMKLDKVWTYAGK